MFKKSIALAAPVAAAAALAAAGLASGFTSADAADSHAGKAPSWARQAGAPEAVPFSCDGRSNKRVWNRAVDGVIVASDVAPLAYPGGSILIPGPALGRDVVSVAFTGMPRVTPGSEGRLQVYLDGTLMEPSDPTGTPFYEPTNLEHAGTQYCRLIGPGRHVLRTVLESFDGGAPPASFFALYNPLLHVELND